MASTLTIQFVARDYPAPLSIGVLAVEDGRMSVCAEAPMHEPHTTAAMVAAARQIISAWFEPQLFASGSEAIWDILAMLTSLEHR